MFAITPNGIGQRVGARRIKKDWALAPGETFTFDADQWSDDLVLAPDGKSLEVGTPPPTVAEVKQEAQRRIIALTGASDFNSSVAKQLNALMRATEIINASGKTGSRTPEEKADEATLQALADGIRAIRLQSAFLEALSPIPHDYQEDKHWS